MPEIRTSVERYLQGRTPTSRLTSFDFCFNHFQRAHEDARSSELASADLERSCLHLASYLASWGMYRGSGELLQCSLHSYIPLVEWIAGGEHGLWGLDVDAYDAAAIDRLLDAQGAVSEALGFKVSGTLASKVLLGVFGCVPAFDRFFNEGFGASGFRGKHLRRLRDFYAENAHEIDDVRPKTFAFAGGETTRDYSRAKVVDMVFFILGGGPAGG